MLFKKIQITFFSTIAFAAPFIPSNTISRRAMTYVEQVGGIVPDALTSCASAPFPAECATGPQAAKFIADAIGGQGFYSPEIGALIALMGFETENFQYNINHFPGRPGQGTRNMQSAEYNYQYARSFPELSAPLAAITTSTATVGLSPDVLNKIMGLVAVDKYSWGSAGWFLKNVCPASVRTALQTGTQDGWHAYMECVGVNSTNPGRLAYWTRAKTTLGF
ncbi:hypothetical protein SBOR_5886 [Sclerotinia borealis F-4128]|uniref:Transglycosylase SLT domain-containing protein n=1 Tax=Sclerotinia borealis (strain F-4128) TaxID=1432307 RepID=W9CGR7_SCLBF|nr:hypothetical protein SBOR_5886 [Sclerotinia borealis F-4128]